MLCISGPNSDFPALKVPTGALRKGTPGGQELGSAPQGGFWSDPTNSVTARSRSPEGHIPSAAIVVSHMPAPPHFQVRVKAYCYVGVEGEGFFTGLWPKMEGFGTTLPRPAQLLPLLLIHFMVPVLILNVGYNNFMVWNPGKRCSPG